MRSSSPTESGFAALAAALRRDTESVLAGYQIADKAAERDLLGLLMQLDLLDGRFEQALARAKLIRALQDKPADKLLSGLRLRAMATAARTHAPGSEAYRQAVACPIQRELAPLPYPVIENDIKSAKASAELIGEGLILGRIREVLQPMADATGSLSGEFAPALVNARLALLAVLPLKRNLIDAYSGYLAQHQVKKPDIWAARDVVLPATGNFKPVTLAVWDSGVDTALFGRIEFGHALKPDPCPSLGLAQRDAANTPAMVAFFKREGVRVVNMSWGGSVNDVESELEQCGTVKTADERKALAREIFNLGKVALPQAFASAPGILLVAAVGNSNNDASFVESMPADIVLPNLITVRAVDRAGDGAPFTSYGATVKVHANGYQVESFLPGGARVALSGTSMASPQVANLAAKLLAVDPTLTPEALIRVITGTAERSADGRRILMDPKRALATVQSAVKP